MIAEFFPLFYFYTTVKLYPPPMKNCQVFALNLCKIIYFERFQILFPKDEATAIAFHLITATENKSNHQMMIIMKAVSDIVKIVEDYLNVSLHEDTMAYSRFVIHLKFLFKTVLSKQNVPEVAGMDFIFTQIKSEYKNVIECVKKIADYIMEKFNYRCTDGDCIYLMLHVVRLYETTLN